MLSSSVSIFLVTIEFKLGIFLVYFNMQNLQVACTGQAKF